MRTSERTGTENLIEVDGLKGFGKFGDKAYESGIPPIANTLVLTTVEKLRADDQALVPPAFAAFTRQ
jgi:hypothetical protein